jgi:hypothetical protein
MNARSDLDRSITEWLVAEVPDRAPERLLEASRAAICTTPQRRAWWPAGRVPNMNNNIVRIAAAVAAVGVALFIGYQLLGSPDPGGPPTVPSPSVSPSEEPSAAASTIQTLVPGMGDLSSGTYLISSVEPFAITITIPDGWESAQVPAQIWGPGDNPKSSVGWFTVDGLFADPCDPTQGYLDVGPTADDLVQALASHPTISVGQTTEVTVSGYAGTLLELTGTAVDCGSAESLFMTTQPGDVDRPHPGDGRFHPAGVDLIVLNVNGDRLAIGSSIGAGAPGETATEIDSIVESTVIEAP